MATAAVVVAKKNREGNFPSLAKSTCRHHNKKICCTAIQYFILWFINGTLVVYVFLILRFFPGFIYLYIYIKTKKKEENFSKGNTLKKKIGIQCWENFFCCSFCNCQKLFLVSFSFLFYVIIYCQGIFFFYY